MAYLHACGITHGDLSGNNVLLTAQPTDPRRWVTMVSDFGLSRIRGTQSVHSAPHGTVTHMVWGLLSLFLFFVCVCGGGGYWRGKGGHGAVDGRWAELGVSAVHQRE